MRMAGFPTTCETMSLHIDMAGPRVAPFPDDVMEKVRKGRTPCIAIYHVLKTLAGQSKFVGK